VRWATRIPHIWTKRYAVGGEREEKSVGGSGFKPKQNPFLASVGDSIGEHAALDVNLHFGKMEMKSSDFRRKRRELRAYITAYVQAFAFFILPEHKNPP
jgi:hypothetical protein